MQLDCDLIKHMRTEKGWTQQQLADISGISLRTVQRVEVHGIASLETTKSLASAFDTSHQALQKSLESDASNASEYGSANAPTKWWMLALAFASGAASMLILIYLTHS